MTVTRDPNELDAAAVAAHISAVAAEFDAVAPDYKATVENSISFSGKSLEFFTQAKVDHLADLGRSLIGELTKCAVLDVGCGTGTTDTLLAPLVGNLHGVDTSAEMVVQARNNNPGCDYRQYDGFTLPFHDATFDLSFAICVMHHVPPAQWVGFAREMLRVTKPEGVAMVFEHNPMNPLTRRAVKRCPFDADAVLLSRERVSATLRAAGGQVVAHRYVLFAPVGGARTRRCEARIGWLPLGAQHVVVARGIGPLGTAPGANVS